MRIPLYNQTGTPSVQTKAQQLSPRASAKAFTQQGQAVAQLGQQIARTGQAVSESMIKFRQQQEKIEFDFAMAEKDAETQRVLNESAVSFNEQSLEFIQNNKDTDTTKFRNSFETFSKDFLAQNVDTRADLTDNQKLRIKTGLNQQIISKSNQGAKNAFDRMQVVRGQQAKDALFIKMQDASSLPSSHPERARLIQEIETDILTNERDGLNTGYTVQGVRIAFEKLDFNSRINGATSFSELDQVTKDIGVSMLGAEGRQTMLNRVNARQKELRGEITQNVVGALFDMELRFDDQDKVIEHIREGKPLEGVNSEGERVVLNSSGLKDTGREAIIATYVGRRFKDLDDIVTQSAVTGIVNQAITGDSPIDLIESATALYDQAEFLNKDEDQIKAIILESAQQMQEEAGRMVASGDFEEGAVNNLLNGSQALIETGIAGKGALVGLAGDDAKIGDTASVVGFRIAKLRETMATANASQARVEAAIDLGSRNQLGFYAEAQGIKPDEVQKAITVAIGQIPNTEEKMEYLEKNGVKFDLFTQTMQVAKTRLSNQDLSFDQLSDEDKQAIVIYESMARRPDLLTKHLSGDDLKWWRTFETFTDLYGMENGLEQMRRVDMTRPIDSAYAAIKDQVEVTIEEAVDQPWWQFMKQSPIAPQNTGYVLNEIRDLTKAYLRQGAPTDKAVGMAAQQFEASHTLIRGIYIQNLSGMPENMSEIADIAVAQFAQDNLQLLEDNDMSSQDLGLINTAGTVDRWYLVRDGAFLMTNEQGKFISYSKDELLKLREEARKKALTDSVNETNRAIQMNRQGGSPAITTETAQGGA